MIYHTFLIADGTCRLHGLLSIAHGKVGLSRIAVYLACNSQDVVGILIGAHTAVGLNGLLYETLGLVYLRDAIVDDSQIEIGACQLHGASLLLAILHSFLASGGCLRQLPLLKKTISAVAQQHGMQFGIVVLCQRQGKTNVLETFCKIGFGVVETLDGIVDEEVNAVGRH